MGIVGRLPQQETCLNDHATSWHSLSDRDYKTLVKLWTTTDFGHLIEAGVFVHQGSRAVEFLASRLPGDVILFSGVLIPRLANRGGLVASAYRAVELRALDRELANDLELVAASVDMTWCCVFSHEAGSFVSEQVYERDVSGRFGV